MTRDAMKDARVDLILRQMSPEGREILENLLRELAGKPKSVITRKPPDEACLYSDFDKIEYRTGVEGEWLKGEVRDEVQVWTEAGQAVWAYRIYGEEVDIDSWFGAGELRRPQREEKTNGEG